MADVCRLAERMPAVFSHVQMSAFWSAVRNTKNEAWQINNSFVNNWDDSNLNASRMVDVGFSQSEHSLNSTADNSNNTNASVMQSSMISENDFNAPLKSAPISDTVQKNPFQKQNMAQSNVVTTNEFDQLESSYRS